MAFKGYLTRGWTFRQPLLLMVAALGLFSSGCSSSDGVDNGVCNAICSTTDWLCGSLKTDDQMESCKINCAHDIETNALAYDTARSMRICIENARSQGSCQAGQECIQGYPLALIPPPQTESSDDASTADADAGDADTAVD